MLLKTIINLVHGFHKHFCPSWDLLAWITALNLPLLIVLLLVGLHAFSLALVLLLIKLHVIIRYLFIVIRLVGLLAFSLVLVLLLIVLNATPSSFFWPSSDCPPLN